VDEPGPWLGADRAVDVWRQQTRIAGANNAEQDGFLQIAFDTEPTLIIRSWSAASVVKSSEPPNTEQMTLIVELKY
jgi:hypothetical protein